MLSQAATGSGGLQSHTRNCIPDKTGPTECGPNCNPTQTLEATQQVVAVDTGGLQGHPGPPTPTPQSAALSYRGHRVHRLGSEFIHA